MAFCCARLSGNAVLPSAWSAVIDRVTWLAVGRSARSTSVKLIDPVSLSVSASVMLPVTSTMATAGASLVPVRVTLTVLVDSPPRPSLMV